MRDVGTMLISSLVALGAGLALAAPAPTTPPHAGHWEGAITVPSGEIAFAADFESGEGGAWKGEVDVPQQGIRNLALVDLVVSGVDVSFTMPGVPGTPTFQGKLAGDGSAISGTLAQAGQSFPFRLERAGAAQFGVIPDDGVKLVERGVPGQGVAGEWHGVLEVGPHKLRLIVAIAAAAEGAFEGTLESVDQGSAKIPLANIAYGTADRSVAFEIPSIGALFTGKLGADGSEAGGQWSQGGPAVPLTFKRAK